MKSKNKPIIAAFLLFAANALYANENFPPNEDFYNEIGYLPLAIHLPYNVTLKPQLVRYVLGVRFKENLDFEGIVGATTDSDKNVRATIGGLFIKPKMSISEDSTVFMRFGPTRTSLDGRASGSLTRIAYGLGFQTRISDNLYWQVDHMHYGSSNSSQSVKGVSTSLGMTF